MYFLWTSLNIYSGKDDLIDLHLKPAEDKENIIYIRGEFRESLGMNFFSPFQPEREFKVNVHKLYAVEYINTVCSLDYLFQFRIF